MTIPTGLEFKTAAIETVDAITRWAQDVFFLKNFPVKVSVTDRKVRYYGLASVTRDKMERFTHFGIKLSSHDFTRYPMVAVTEYASFNADKIIGGFKTNDWRLGVDALVAHEMAHAIQFALRISAFDYKAVGQDHPLITSWRGATPTFQGLGEYEGNHGDFFQAIYRKVREQFINHRVSRSAFTAPSHSFIIPDNFEERLAKMPKSPLEGIRFVNNGRPLTVVGYNPNRNKLFNYQVRDDAGKFFRCKMSLIVMKSVEAKRIVESDPKARAEWQAHCMAQQNKSEANRKSRVTKARRSLARAA